MYEHKLSNRDLSGTAMLCNVVLGFESVDEILKRDH